MEVLADLDEKYLCPNCGTKMNKSNVGPEETYVCPECGCTIEASEQNLDSDNICPNCYQLLDGNECPHCGYDLGSDFD